MNHSGLDPAKRAARVAAMGVALGFSAMAIAAPPQAQRIRGTIQSISGETLTVQPYDGGSGTKVMLSSGTKYAWVVKSSLSSVKKGDFIGTAAMGPENHMTAQEVVIFPNSMRGTGEGHYPWSMPVAVARNDAGSGMASGGHSSMTNGTVSATASQTSMPSSMTNGTVSATTSQTGAASSMTNGSVASTMSQGGAKKLTISYGNGQTVQVTVPANAPVVRFQPASKSILKQDRKAFIVAGPKGNARFVAIGKNGLMPPM